MLFCLYNTEIRFLCGAALSICGHNSAHKSRSTYWAALTAWKLGGKGTHDLILHHWKRRTWQTKACNPKMNTSLLTTEPAWTPADFKWALHRCKCLPVTGSGLAGDSLTIHLPLCTSQLSCPENRNTNSVSMLRSLIVCLPPPTPSTGWVSLSLQSAAQLQDLASNGLGCERYNELQYSLGWIEVGHSPQPGGLRAPQLLLAEHLV